MLGTQTAHQLGQFRVSRICIGSDKVKPSDFLLLQSLTGFRRLNGKEFSQRFSQSLECGTVFLYSK